MLSCHEHLLTYLVQCYGVVPHTLTCKSVSQHCHISPQFIMSREVSCLKLLLGFQFIFWL